MELNNHSGASGDSAQVIITMGVEGSGKTTIGRMLAGALGCEFHDADDFHSPQAKSKMAAGVALTDDDRHPWLDALRGLIVEHLCDGVRMVLACSALKESYREVLMVDPARVVFVHLHGDMALIRKRLRERSGHYAGVSLLASQFETLEEPRDAVIVDIADTPDRIAASIRSALGL
jgi:gluconokinase